MTWPNPCPHHEPKRFGGVDYVNWHLWAESQHKKGIKQTQCPECLHWYFPEEMGEVEK